MTRCGDCRRMAGLLVGFLYQFAWHLGERSLAPLQRPGPHVQALQLQEVEAEELHVVVVMPGVQPVEIAHALLA